MGIGAIVYVWHVAAIVFIGWWGLAFIRVIIKKVFHPDADNSTSEIINADSLGALSTWLGVWNGFYVWKDLDEDYWRRNRDQ